MAAHNWRYTSPQGRQYIVGLFHGPETGHFMVHCNNQVILVDFHVKAPASYSFFIEEELCAIKIDSGPRELTYSFTIDPAADTQPNRDRKALREAEKRHYRLANWIALAFFTFVFVLAIILVALRAKSS